MLFVLRRTALGASQTGRLTVTLPSGATLRHIGARPGPDAILTLRRWRALWRMMTGGSVGLARAYIDGDCHSPDIGAVLAFGVRNEAALSRTRRPAQGVRAFSDAFAIGSAPTPDAAAAATSLPITISATPSTPAGSTAA